MKRRSLFGTSIAMVASLALAGTALAVNGFSNGSFEGGPGGTTTLSGGSTAIPGWTVTGTDIDWVSVTDLWQAADGTKSLDLNGYVGAGGVQQSFATTIGNTYVVQFYLSGNPGTCAQYGGTCSLPLKTMTVTAAGGAVASYSFDTSIRGNTFTNMLWTLQSAYTFVATSASTTLTFASTTVGSFGPALDNVTVTETAATGANCKKGGWQTMIDTSGNSFKNQGDCVSFYATDGQNLGAIAP